MDRDYEDVETFSTFHLVLGAAHIAELLTSQGQSPGPTEATNISFWLSLFSVLFRLFLACIARD
jgi:hypothetical protein